MDLLNAINGILPKLGEHPVTSLTARSPTLAIILPMIDRQIKKLAVRGWWFNTHSTTLLPDVAGAISIPASTLSFVARDYVVSIRGTQLHNSTDNTFTWPADGVYGKVIEFVPFEELPESVAQWVFYSALVEACVTDIGLTPETRVWQAEADDASRAVLSEHLQNKKYTTQNSARYGRIRRAMRG